MIRRPSLKAVIFDFNGVIVDDEPLHKAALCQVLRDQGIEVTDDQYRHCFLGREDGDCFRFAFERAGRFLPSDQLETLVQHKFSLYHSLVQRDLRLFPGALELVRQCALRYPIALASGARRCEIEFVLARFNLERVFRSIVSAEDVPQGKPEPLPFWKALESLNWGLDPASAILPGDCLVVEDSQAGVTAALRAGMKVLAVTHSLPPSSLSEAHLVVESLEVELPVLERVFATGDPLS
ncbi:MAG: HAD family phosphatase [Acidobacteriota bacterium]